MAEWTTGAAILTQAGAAPGSPDDEAWAEVCAGAVNGGLDARLVGAWGADVDGLPLPAPDPLPPELVRLAVTAGVQAYKAREASVDAQPNVDAIVGDYLAAGELILRRYATVGIG